MKQVIAGSTTTLGVSTAYGPLMGQMSANAGSWVASCVIPTSGVLSEFRVKLSAAPGAGKSRALSVFINNNPYLDITVSDTATIGVNTGSIAVSTGDQVCIRCVVTGSPAAAFLYSAINFTGDIAGESIILGNTAAGGLSTTATRYSSLANPMTPTATELDCRQVIPTPGTFKKLCWGCGDPGDAPDGYKITLRKATGGGALGSTALTSTIVANDTGGSDLANEVSVAAGDTVALMFEIVSTPTNATAAIYGLVFVADADGESLILGGSTDALNSTATEYNSIPTQGLAWAAEYTNHTILNACTLKKLYVELSGSPRGNNDADSYTIAVRYNGGDTGIVTTISDGGTGNKVGNDTTHSYNVDTSAWAGDPWTIRSVPSSSPAAVDAYWGLVCYIQEQVSITPTIGSLSISGIAPRNDRGIFVPTEVDA